MVGHRTGESVELVSSPKAQMALATVLGAGAAENLASSRLCHQGSVLAQGEESLQVTRRLGDDREFEADLLVAPDHWSRLATC